MTIEPDFGCPCSKEHLKEALRYREKPIGETDFKFEKSTYERSFFECGPCGHFFAKHEMDLDQVYSAEYVDSTYGGKEGMERRLAQILGLDPARSDNAQRVDRICKFYEDLCSAHSGHNFEKKLLDIGSGIGVFPAAMKTRGWDVTGIEPDPRTVELLVSVVGIRALEVDFLELTTQEIGRFDVVTLNKVLEHVEKPHLLVRHLKEFLSPTGFAYIEVPDVQARSEGKHREEFFVEHHHVFSPASVAMLAEHSGLRVVRLERLVEPSGKFTLCAFLQNL